jgi:hypothetical protein
LGSQSVSGRSRFGQSCRYGIKALPMQINRQDRSVNAKPQIGQGQIPFGFERQVL